MDQVLPILIGLVGLLYTYFCSPDRFDNSDWLVTNGEILEIKHETSLGGHEHGVSHVNHEYKFHFRYYYLSDTLTSDFYLQGRKYKVDNEIEDKNLKNIGNIVKVFVNPENEHETMLDEYNGEIRWFWGYVIFSIFMFGGFYNILTSKKND